MHLELHHHQRWYDDWRLCLHRDRDIRQHGAYYNCNGEYHQLSPFQLANTAALPSGRAAVFLWAVVECDWGEARDDQEQELLGCNQALERPHGLLFVRRFFDWGFGDEGGVGEARIIQKAAERLYAHGSFADVLVPVEL